MRFDGKYVYANNVTFDMGSVVAILVQTENDPCVRIHLQGGGVLGISFEDGETALAVHSRLVGWLTRSARPQDVIDIGEPKK